MFFIKNTKQLTKLYCKCNLNRSAGFFENIKKLSVKEIAINPLYCVFLPCFTWQCRMKYTNNDSQTLQGKDTISLLENNIRGDISSVMGDRQVNSDEIKKI